MDSPVTERRRRTEEKILRAAQELFAANDYEKTTIRAVAARADVDPALVIRYFGDKEGLFRRAVRLPGPASPGDGAESAGDGSASPDDGATSPVDGAGTLADQLTRSLGVKLGGLSPASLALLRSMFTHPEAAVTVRAAMSAEADRLGAAAPGPDAALRSGLAAAMLLGVSISRQLLELPVLADASVADIQRVLRPVLDVLMGQADEEREF